MLRFQAVAWLSSALVGMLQCNTIEAREAPASTVLSVQIPAQPLKQALNEWASQTGFQIAVLAETQASALTAPKVSGLYTPEVALKLLLANTGLAYKFVDARTVAIHTTSAGKDSVTSSTDASAGALRLASAADQEIGAAAAEDDGSTTHGETLQEVQVGMPEILISGKRVLNMDIRRSRDDAQPYVVLDRTMIERSGARDVNDLLRTRLTASTTASSNMQIGNDSGNTSLIDLRGLGSQQTLILIDGHRAVSASLAGTPIQPDLNGIPLAAIERIEILPTTASGIYGGGATGGVVNVVLRRDYEGAQAKLTYDDSFSGGGSSRRADLSLGFNLGGGKTNLLLAGSYADGDPLLVAERDYLQKARARVVANNPTAFFDMFASPPLGATSNIASAAQFDPNTFTYTQPNLTLKGSNAALGSAFTFVPVGYAGPASDDGDELIQNAGGYNFALANTAQSAGGGRQGLLSAPTIESLAATLRHEFSPRVEGFIEAFASNNESSYRTNPAGSTFFLSGADPGNPFNEDINITTPAIGADQVLESTTQNRRFVGGIIVKLGAGWLGAADHTWNRDRISVSRPSSGFDSAAGLDASTGTLQLFRDTNAFDTDFGSYVLQPGGYSPVRTTLNDTNVRLSGPLPWALPAGALTLSMLAEHRKESIDDAVQSLPVASDLVFMATDYSRSQTVDSLYLETKIPLISAQNAFTGARLLELQLAGRWDQYKTIGANQSSWILGVTEPEPPIREKNTFSSIDPTVALRYQPVSDITLRASYSTGFLPPQVNQLIQTLEPFPNFFPVTDPLRNDEPIGLHGDVILASGGNPNLRPEESESVSAGIILTPQFAPGLRMSIDWTEIKKTDNISEEFGGFDFVQQNLENELFIPGFVERGPSLGDGLPGPITRVNTILLNVARQDVEALDLALDYTWKTASRGDLTFTTIATRAIHNITQTILSAPEVESVGLPRGGLEWNGHATLAWDYRRWTAAWTTRYFDSYFLNPTHEVDINQGTAKVPSQIYHDIFVGFHAGSWLGDNWLTDSEIQLGVRNVFDKAPPIVATDILFGGVPYSTYGDPRRASYYLTLRMNF